MLLSCEWFVCISVCGFVKIETSVKKTHISKIHLLARHTYAVSNAIIMDFSVISTLKKIHKTKCMHHKKLKAFILSN